MAASKDTDPEGQKDPRLVEQILPRIAHRVYSPPLEFATNLLDIGYAQFSHIKSDAKSEWEICYAVRDMLSNKIRLLQNVILSLS